ncbi:hypothetical protein JRO89_XS01G0343400 [Xanthoceras sorbifolium]|uniref:O-methyltransferase domain-containing protein n=1 Tax=Xanthoceras sorbifolium TaxID=99658 RepID=A0ABQ8IN26_9ROSI|nr:hypothetical protein JRO89_XS01G0343400 [Xanthoceras sorbifolium]
MPPPVETQQPNPNAQKEEEEEEAYYSYANNLAMSVVLPMAMRTAVELDVFEIIGKAGPGAKLSALEIATQIPTGSSGFLPAIECLIVPFLTGKGWMVFLPWQNTLPGDAPLLSEAQGDRSVHPGPPPDLAATNPRFNEVYNKALFNHTSYHCDEEDRVEHLSGDMFQTIPKGDAIILKFIVKECYEAIPEDGKVIVINGVLPVVLETNEAARDISLLHVRLLIMRDDGATERTKEEFVALASGSGFKGVNVSVFGVDFG